ncbi:MAG: DUF1343 domain-containing protein [Chitinophagaceae bacterium]|nr:DUF1343 domain-containing protein [Chitinophagaceae bacterium]
MVYFGIDRLLQQEPSWKKSRLALVTNRAATTRKLVPSRQAIQEAGFNLVKLFSPEHGLDLQGADGHLVKDGIDPLTRLPVVSLYGEKFAPTEKDLNDTDLVLFDIPDIGCRFYTYLWTLSHLLEACAAQGKKLIVLDRPNPVSGKLDLAEGPMLDEKLGSFIGRWPIPLRHSTTLGELAGYFNHTRSLGCELEIIKCANWEREMFQPDWEMTFVAPSPAICHYQSMLLYPALGLLEATNISEGRGTEHSFQLAGAPWIDGAAIAGILNDMGLDEVLASPIQFTPRDPNGKYCNQLCGGVKLQVKEPEYFKPVSYGLMLIYLVRQLYPQQFEWSPYPTLVNPDGKQHLDKLLGVRNSEALFGLPLPKFIATITKLTSCVHWATEIGEYLFY